MWNRSENQITLVMIRHGATESNKKKRYLGRTDEELSEEGILELKRNLEQGRYPEVEYLFTSPMKRCMETAKIIYPHKPSIQIPDWVEIDFGAFEGKNYVELQDDVRYQAWIDSGGMLPFPEGESRETFLSRAQIGLLKMRDQILQQLTTQTEGIRTVGIVVHGGTIMSLLSRYYGGGYFDYQVTNGGGYLCKMKLWEREPRITKITNI